MTRWFNVLELKPRRRFLRKRQTDAEKAIWYLLRNRNFLGFRFLRQFSVGPFILDFYCPSRRLAVEIDGTSHATKAGIERDRIRTDFLTARNIRVIRFWNHEAAGDTAHILARIEIELRRPVGTPNPSRPPLEHKGRR